MNLPAAASGKPGDPSARSGRRRSRRLRKKLHLGEFREFGFEVALHLDAALSASAEDAFWNAFIIECIEGRGLSFGGSTTGYICRAGRGSATTEDRAAVHAWLAARTELTGFELGPLSDVWHPDESTGDEGGGA